MVDTARQGRVAARLLAVADSRSLVRALFLSSALLTGLLPALRTWRTVEALAREGGIRRPERLEAWLQVGVELGELRRRGDRFRVHGRRARALAEGDELLVPHYRSILEYQVGPYAELGSLLLAEPGAGRDDLDRHADDIARVSLAGAPFVARLVGDAIREIRPTRVLDVGCGTGVYSRAVLDAAPEVQVVGIDLSEDVVAGARRELERAGLAGRCRLHVGDVRRWLAGTEERFPLVMLLNNVYYFAPSERVDLYRQLAGALPPGGQLLVTTMTTPGSVASAHLHLMLTGQAGSASLPSPAELVDGLVTAGLSVVAVERPVPTEPFLAVRAAK